MSNNNTITLHVSDMTGQRQFVARDVPTDASWGETMDSIMGKMDLPANSPDDEAVWMGRLEREGRQLRANEIVGDACRDQDHVVFQKEVNAG